MISTNAILEQDVSLSSSLVWNRQKDYYARRGIGVWSDDKLPTYITSNPFIAESYARIAAAFIRDCFEGSSNKQNSERVRIIEFGAATGKFAYLFLRQLVRLLESEGIQADSFCYCMTDCSPTSIQTWSTNSYLSKFVEAGHLSFELLEAGEEKNSIFLSSSDGPLIAISNYYFDSLPNDLFVFEQGQIFESVITTTRSHEDVDDGPQEPLSGLDRTFRTIPFSDDRYPDAEWNHILKSYAATLPSASVLFPVAAFQTISELRKASGPLLVLAADKGLIDESDLLSDCGGPHFEFHGPNCFSHTVNFDAIAKYSSRIGGRALLPNKRSSNLLISGFLFDAQDCKGLEKTEKTYRETQEAFGVEDLFALMAWLRPFLKEASVAQFLAVLKLSRWDPVALQELFPLVIGRLSQIPLTCAEQADLRNAIIRTQHNHFPIGPADSTFELNCRLLLQALETTKASGLNWN